MIDISNLKINFHLFEKCNMSCLFCYRDKSKNFNIGTFEQYKKIIDKLYEIGFRKINFAGGEPTLFSSLDEVLKYSYELGFSNSIISNGYIEDKDNLENIINNLLNYLDTYGLSIDSLDEGINFKTGRFNFLKRKSVTLEDVYRIYLCVKNKNKKFKINTVVTNLNKNDKSLLKILEKGVIVDRWKFLRVHPSPNRNNEKFFLSDEEYLNFINLFKNKTSNICVEDKGAMINSYIMINSEGDISVDSTKKDVKSINIFSASKWDVINFINENLDKEKYFERY